MTLGEKVVIMLAAKTDEERKVAMRYKYYLDNYKSLIKRLKK